MEKSFVSRAGHKLEFALDHFKVDVSGTTCADLGCSTGGFTDCLLQRGASKIYDIDTAYGELAWKLRQDPRVIVMEKTNALNVDLPEKMDFVVIDLGWTRQKLALPKALELAKSGATIISLIKPHYEAPREYLQKGQLKPEHLNEVIQNVMDEIRTLLDGKALVEDPVESPILGDKGKNREFLLLVRKN